MKLLGVDHIDIVVSDVVKSVEFYRKFGLFPEGTIDDGERDSVADILISCLMD